MKTYDEMLSNERLVQKFLISLSKVHDPICLVIENTKSLETAELQEVIAILKSQEQRFELHNIDATEKAFASFTVSPKSQNKNAAQSGPSKSQKNWNPKSIHKGGCIRGCMLNIHPLSSESSLMGRCKGLQTYITTMEM
ncbi:hypothetical protein L3X38_010478 [Prunus dulcis]|uniref:Uncharacterized protein n=1 Tax=Prunus dulcis TaxID=3755 RepID=A0AAD4WFM4_PRUDU|nr:hypothetical protein L3X38_010478 [Prunus dulcis]